MKIVKPRSPYPPKSTLVFYGAGQSEYETMPAIRHNDEWGTVTSCWRLSLWERLVMLFTGEVYVQLLTYNKPIMPQLLSIKNPW